MPHLPLFPTLHGYQRGWLRSDIIAGLSAGAVVIPQAMAYATIADLPVEYGLYTCMVPMFVYAMLGGSRAMSVSTTSTIATLTATTFVSAGIAASSSAVEGELVTLTLLVGALLLLARVFRLASIIEIINEATLIGVKVGLGAVVALGQVPKLLGTDVSPTGGGFVHTLNATIAALPQSNLATVALSVATIATLVLLGRFAPRVPAQLLVAVVGILLATFTGLQAVGVDVIGRVPTGLPLPGLASLDRIPELIPGALAIAVMAFLETASVARGIRRAGEPQIDSNRELLAAGAASVLGAFLHSLPAAGGFSQSAVNQRAGARSQLSSIVTVALAVLVALFLAPVLSNLPQATLAAMVFVAVIGLIDVKAMARLARVSRIEFWIAILTAAIGLSAGLLAAVAAGVVFTLGLVLHELARVRIDSRRDGSILVITLRSPLYAASVLATQRAMTAELDSWTDATALVLEASVLQVTSLTVIDALADFDRELAERQVTLFVVGLGGDALTLARRTSWWLGLEAAGRTACPSPRSGDPTGGAGAES